MKSISSFKRLIGLYALAVAAAMLCVSLNASPALAGRKLRIRRLESRLSRLLATSGGNCMQNEYNDAGFTQTLNCTANDVQIARVTDIRDPVTGNPITTCNLGGSFNFLADFIVVTTSKSSRSNIGLYFAIDGGNAKTGQCVDSIIAPQHDCSSSSSVQCGSASYEELDSAPDNCGDTSSSDGTVCLDANGSVVSCPAPAGGTTYTGAQVVTIEVDNFPCEPPTGSNQLVMNDCTSWQTPGSALQCVSSPPNYPYVDAAVAGSPSKCHCGTIGLNITAQTPSVTVTKQCSVDGGTTYNSSSCSLPDPGGTVTYKVDVTNTSNFGSLTLNQICDSAYGNVFTATTNPAQPACPAATVGTITSTTCSSSSIDVNGEYSCTFTADQAEDSSVKDTVTVKGVGQGGTPFSGGSNAVTVTAGEADSTASTIKTSASASPSYGCATVRYGVEVDNTSASTNDETESLSALTDSYFGNIAVGTGQPPLGTDVLGTTCGVATGSPGEGTLSGSTGAGLLPAKIAVGSKYICQFDAKVCGNTVPLSEPTNATNCAAGIENTDTVSGTIVGDESEAVTQKTGKLTVDVCFSTSMASQ